MLPPLLSESERPTALHLIILSNRAVLRGQSVTVLSLVGFVILLILRLLGVGVGGLFIGFFQVSSVVGIWVGLCTFLH
jgi:hypothetical protein